jgi:putative ABC transport system ATP-binding protein
MHGPGDSHSLAANLLCHNVVSRFLMSPAILQIENLKFAYGERTVLHLPKLEVQAERSCAVIGPSGCGKTTLMHLIAGLLKPTQGRIQVAGQEWAELSASDGDRFRGRNIGIVFQRLHLLPALNVLENLLLAQRCARVKRGSAAASALLDRLGVGDLAARRPQQLSQGQAQRVAIARALVHRPRLLIADEPTSSLDEDNAQRALTLLRDQARACGAALLVVTHDQRIRGQLDEEMTLEPAP